jgi:plastocyanin
LCTASSEGPRPFGWCLLALALLCLGLAPASALAAAGHAHTLRGAGRRHPAPKHAAPAHIHFGGPAALQQVSYPAGVERLHYRYGPILVSPGTNLILIGNKPMPKPEENGYVLGLVPNLTLPNGTVPPTDVLHLHHGVWLSTASSDTTEPGLSYERFFATGEEKTQLHLPAPYGYPVSSSDRWLLNYMIHNLTTRSYTVFLTYEVDWVPLNSPLGQTIRPVRPVWMDVRNGEAYPVFNALRGSGSNGTFTYPDREPGAYTGASHQLNEWTVDRPGTLVWAGGHLHPGGLYDTLEMTRPGAHITPQPGQPPPLEGATPGSVRLFRSSAHYWDPRGPISWDLAMSVTQPGWRVTLKPGDVLRISTTYDSRRASWYEAMGIMVLWMAEGESGVGAGGGGGVDPYLQSSDQTGDITHGRLPENVDEGGAMSLGLPNPKTLPNGHAPHNTIDVKNFVYQYGGYGLPGNAGDPPTVKQGQSLTFVNLDNPQQIFHTITACQTPCARNGGISYPLASAPLEFDSRELGTGPPGLPGFTPASGAIAWKTPANLPPGTYTYFCRIHPFMRGSFRVVRQ